MVIEGAMEKINLILIHGGPGLDDSYFYPYLDQLKDEYDVSSYTVGSTIQSSYSFEKLCQELDHFISSIAGPIILLGHSFGANICMNMSEYSWARIDRLILCNWVHDNAWIELYFSNCPQALDVPESYNLKESLLELKGFYFKDEDKGRDVIEGINFNYDLSDAISSYVLSCDESSILELHSDKIISISCSNDSIISEKYILRACNTFGITNYSFNGLSHFPFVDDCNVFCKKINHIIKENYEYLIKK